MTAGASGAPRRGAGRRWTERLLVVPSGVTGQARRRTRTLLGVATILAAAVFPVIVLALLTVPDDTETFGLALLGLITYLVIRLLVSAGRVVLAAWLFVGYFVVVPLNALLPGETPDSIDLMYISLVPLMAAIVLPPRHVLAACGIAFVEFAALASMSTDVTTEIKQFTTYAIILLGIIAAASYVLTVLIDRAFAEVDATRVEAQRLADELQVANAELEQRVRSRTEELADALQREQRLSSQLAELSVRDSLTGLHNRRHMDEAIDQMFRYAKRSRDPLSVAVIDLDDFKPINDRHTHLVGDQVLRQVASVLSASTRGSDELVRMGGEEFALLMPGTASAEAITVCERMRDALESHDWGAITPGIVVTASFGIATTGVAREVSELLRSADEQLLLAKRAGKNRVLCASAEVA